MTEPRAARRARRALLAIVAFGVVPLAACGGGGNKATPTSSPSPSATTAPGSTVTGGSDSSTTTGEGGATATTGPGATTSSVPGSGSASGPGSSTPPGSTGGTGGSVSSTPGGGPVTTAPRRTTTTTRPSSGGVATDTQLDQAYAAGWTALCREVWSHSTNSLLYEPDDVSTSYTIKDCLDDLDVTYRFDDTLAAARAEGRQDAIDDLFGISYSGYLCWLDNAQNVAGCFNADKGTYGPPPAG